VRTGDKRTEEGARYEPLEPHLWGVVLSGGEGELKLWPFGSAVTSDRSSMFLSSATVTCCARPWIAWPLRIRSFQTACVTLAQPSRFFVEPCRPVRSLRVCSSSQRNRGTAAGILFPIHWGARQDSPMQSSRSFLRITSCSEPATFMALVRESPPGSASTPPGWCSSVLTPTGPEVEVRLDRARKSAGLDR